MGYEKLYSKDFNVRGGDEGNTYSMGGRVIAKRSFGKLIFATIKDQRGTFQMAFQQNDLGENMEKYRNMKTGDVLSVEGESFLTKGGERTLNVQKGEIIATCLDSMPDKYNGVSRKEGQINRGLDLMTNEDSMNLFIKRNNIIKEIRQFLYGRNFQELDTGILQNVTNTSPSTDFVTYSTYFGKDLFLRKTPELRLKQLLVGGLEDIFEMGKNFRNEGVSKQYHPEYTILELYKNNAKYTDVLGLTLDLIKHLSNKVYKPSTNPAEVEHVNLYDFIKREAKVDPKSASIDDLLKKISPEIRKDHGDDEKFHKGFYTYDLFRTLLKQFSNTNLVLHGVPKEISVLGKTFEDEPDLVEEFRYFVKGNLICNGITELTDYGEQKRRIEQQAKTLGKDLDVNDDQFLKLIRLGLPPCSGIGLGVEKTLMTFLETEDIRDVIYFPL